ncbi:hypothetical protein FXV77_04420 [Sphingobacterium phlebotomi]|uniref:Uncharacterized protein n=1 Tax=Sphingobacterium phlebotomi TaxID=2605433 RepID=A0A5D4HAN1_9SPHI|nr:hypothetical protein [Sphingobacterium phlebotomi]TYR37263.1 hypothetical protein FXV77_04420 [Sphingobacterium phlebotomi]
MMNSLKYIFAALLACGFSFIPAFSQQLGLNFNHNPENIDFKYVKKINVEWIRATPRILDYVDGMLVAETDTSLQKIVEAGKIGYRIAFGFRWDFKRRNLTLPEPGSASEAAYFKTVDKIMDRVGAYVDIFKLANEPNLETIDSDLEYNDKGKVPLIVFTERLMNHIIAYYKNHPTWTLPEIYAGSLPALFEKKQQQTPGVYELIKFAQSRAEVKGLAVHLHIADTLQIPQALDFVRTLMPDKPIIVPEFSLFRLYNKHFGDSIAGNAKGLAFVQKYQLPTHIKIHEWLTLVNTGKIPYQQWEEMFLSQDWYVPNYLHTYYRYFKAYNVVLATYPLFQQGYTKDVKASSDSWFLNPLFLQKSYNLDPFGEYYTNPLSHPDFTKLLEKQ